MASKKQYMLEILLGAKQASSFRSTINGAQSEFRQIGNSAKKIAGVVTAAFAGVNIAGGIKDAMQTYSEFDQSLATSGATFGATSTQMEQLEKAAREAGRSTSKTASESADALGYMALAGWNVNESTESLMPVLKASVASNLDLAETSDLVTDSMSALKLPVSELPQYLDAVVKGNDSANMTSQQMMEAMILSGGAANTLKIGYEDLGTAIGVLANNGTKGTKAGTAVNSMLTRIASNTNAIKMMKKLRISIFDANGEFVGLEKALIAINKGTAGLNTEDKAQALKQIAGTQYYSKMVYLLDSVKKSADGTGSAWDELNDKISNAEGSLDKKYDKMTDTVTGHTQTMQSAFEDLQISFSDAFDEEYMDVLDGLSGVFNELSENISDFAEENEIAIHNFAEGVIDGIGSVLDTVGDGIEFFVKNSDYIAAGLKGIGTTIVAYKVVSGLTGVAKGLMNLNPATLGIGGAFAVVGGIVAIGNAIKATKERAANANLERHFGNISLSLEQIDDAARGIIGKKNLAQVENLLSSVGETEEKLEDMAGNLRDIGKIEWKLDAGLKLTKDDKEAYQAKIKEYVKNAQSVIDNQGYTVSIATNFLFGKNSKLGKENDAFYAGLDKRMTRLTKKLNKRLAEAVKNGVDIDTDKAIQKLLGKIDHITEAVTNAENEAKLQSLELKYSGAELDSKTFKQMSKDIAKYEKEIAEGAQTAFETEAANSNAKFNMGKITEAERDSQIASARQAYYKKTAAGYKKGMKFVTNTIYEAYPMLKHASEMVNAEMDKALSEAAKEGLTGKDLNAKMHGIASRVLTHIDLPEDTRNAMKQLYESGLSDMISGMDDLIGQMEKTGVKVPESFKDGVENAGALAALTGSTDNMFSLLSDKISNNTEMSAIVGTCLENGGELPSSMTKGIREGTPAVVDAVRTMYEAAKNATSGTLFQGEVRVTSNMATSALGSGNAKKNLHGSAGTVTDKKGKQHTIYKNALGGIYNSEILTTVAEEGPEAIIPLDGSGRAKTLLKRAAAALGYTLSDHSSGGANAAGVALAGGSAGGSESIQIRYAPQITITGNANRSDVENALDSSQRKFATMFEQYLRSRDRISFGH